MSDDRIIVSEPSGRNPETAGLAVEKANNPRGIGSDYHILNFWSSGTAEPVYVDEGEIDELIRALENIKRTNGDTE